MHCLHDGLVVLIGQNKSIYSLPINTGTSQTSQIKMYFAKLKLL